MAAQLSASSTQEKARVLPSLLAAEDIALVIAFGTAAIPADSPTQNGCVIVGANAYLHDPKVKDTTSHWPCPVADQLLTSTIGPVLVKIPTWAAFPAIANGLLLPIPIVPATPPTVKVDLDFVAVTEINVTNSNDYAIADKEVLDAYAASGNAQPVGSLDTTLGVPRACMPQPALAAPFLFVAGITDQVGAYGTQVVPATYQQNFVAAHNAGVTVAQMVPTLLSLISSR